MLPMLRFFRRFRKPLLLALAIVIVTSMFCPLYTVTQSARVSAVCQETELFVITQKLSTAWSTAPLRVVAATFGLIRPDEQTYYETCVWHLKNGKLSSTLYRGVPGPSFILCQGQLLLFFTSEKGLEFRKWTGQAFVLVSSKERQQIEASPAFQNLDPVALFQSDPHYTYYSENEVLATQRDTTDIEVILSGKPYVLNMRREKINGEYHEFCYLSGSDIGHRILLQFRWNPHFISRSEYLRLVN